MSIPRLPSVLAMSGGALALATLAHASPAPQAGGTLAAPSAIGTQRELAPLSTTCPPTIRDGATAGCMGASSVPQLGSLYPMSPSLNVRASDGHVGMGTTFPLERLQLGEFGTAENTMLEMRTIGGPGTTYKQGLKLRSSNPFFGFDIEHDDSLKGLNVTRWDDDMGVYGGSALYIDRLSGYVGLGTTTPQAELEVIGNDGNNADIRLQRAGETFGYDLAAGFDHFFLVRNDGTTGTNQLIVDGPTGNVSIGNITAAQKLHVDGSAILNGRLGIGTTAPGYAIEVSKPFGYGITHTGTSDGVVISTYTAATGGWIGTRSNTSFHLYANDGSASLTVLPNTNVGIGNTNPSQKLDVNGNVRCVSLIQTSDARLKKDVRELDGALALVGALHGVSYEWDAEKLEGAEPGRRIGFLAQEVAEVLPEAVRENADGVLGVSYAEVVPVLVEAMQEQQGELERLRATCEELLQRLEALEGE